MGVWLPEQYTLLFTYRVNSLNLTNKKTGRSGCNIFIISRPENIDYRELFRETDIKIAIAFFNIPFSI